MDVLNTQETCRGGDPGLVQNKSQVWMGRSRQIGEGLGPDKIVGV